MKIMTVADLWKLCETQVSLGNGKKNVYISADDEGNSFHALFYGFTTNQEVIDDFMLPVNVKTKEDIVLLG